MQVNPYLFYDGNCEAAFKYYEKVLGGKIEFLMRADEGPADMKPEPGNEKEDHACADVDQRSDPDGVRCASRTFPQAAGLLGVADSP